MTRPVGGGRLAGFRDSARRIVPLAWPVFVGQVAVLAFSTVDTVLVARYAAADLAALAVGAAAYITVFVGLMGVLLAIGPIAGQLFGARRPAEAGRQLHQAVWLALALSLAGSLLLVFPQPFIALAKATPEVADKVRGYMQALAVSLPAALLFTVYRGFNTAVSRPKAVMALQVGGLVLKVPLSMALVFGAGPLPSLGVTGCGVATAITLWGQALGAWWLMRRDPFYAPFALFGHGLQRPDWSSMKALLRLGVPMGLSVGIEVTGFTFMAFFISRISVTAVAGHQIAVNLVSLMFMAPLALANATSTLVAQRLGAEDLADARKIGWDGLRLGIGLAALVGTLVFATRGAIVRFYTADAAVVGAALPLLAWVAVFHVFDAMQCLSAFILRAWRIAFVPLVIYAGSIWGIGLGGGYALAFDIGHWTPPAFVGARGFWAASTDGLALAGIGLSAFLAWAQRHARSAVPVSTSV